MSFRCLLYSGNHYEATADLNIRTGPSAASSSIGVIKTGGQVVVTDSSNAHWFKVNYNGMVGYVAEKYLIHIPDTVVKPVVTVKQANTERTNSNLVRNILILCVSTLVLLLVIGAAVRRSKQQARTIASGDQRQPATHKSKVVVQSNADDSTRMTSNIPIDQKNQRIAMSISLTEATNKDDSIIDVTGKSTAIKNDSLDSGLTKYEHGVPKWSHRYIYGAHELSYAGAAQKAFYAIFKSAFIKGVYYDVEGNSNYPFILLFDLEEACKQHNDVDLLQQQYKALGKYYPKTANYTLDIVIRQYQRIGASESAQELRQLQRTYTNSPYDFHADYWGFGTRSKKKFNLTDAQVKVLNKLIDTSNNFNSIDYISKHLIFSLFDSIENLKKHFVACGTSLEEQVGKIAEVELLKHYKFRKGSRNYKDQFAQFTDTVNQCIFKTAENKFREKFFIGRKTEFTWYIRSSEALELFNSTFADPLDRSLCEYIKRMDEPDDQTEEAFNAYSKARWKSKLEGIKLGYTEHQKFYEAVKKLGLQNSKNPAVENIFFEASKHIAKTDKVTALKLYIHYVDHDLRSVAFDNKQFTKTLQKSLFQTPEQSADFERILGDLVKNKKLEPALGEVEKIYQPRRRKIVLDKKKIQEVQEQHSDTVELLNEYLQDEVSSLPNLTKVEEFVESVGELTSSDSIFKSELGLSRMQIDTLVMICKNGYCISLTEFEVFAKSIGAFKDALVEGINEKCYEILDDVLIEESEENYIINELYYEKLLAQ